MTTATMRCLALVWACCLLLASASSSAPPLKKKSKLVSTQLSSPWAQTPFLLELAEFLATEDNAYFWQFVDFWTEEEAKHGEGQGPTEEEQYEQAVSFASRFLSWTQLNLLRFSLALRTQSPRIEMFQQIALDRGVPGRKCPGGYVVDFRGQLSCDLAKIDLSASDSSSSNEQQLFKVDHHYPRPSASTKPKPATLILYAEPGTRAFGQAHTTLKQLAEQGKVDYVLRPYLEERSEQKVQLSGYGVELQIKSTEYKAQDDRKVQADDADSGSGSDDDGGSQDVEGFDFDRLNQLHPDDKENLAEFKQHLQDQRDDMAPLKVWQLQDLSLQAAGRILDSPVEKQLQALNDIAQNFPSHARSLSKTKVAKELKKEVKRNQENFLMNMNVQPNDASLYINGMYFDMDFVDIFTILDTLKSEGRVLDGLGRLGLTDEQARKMISLDFTSNKQTYGVDVRDSAVAWINDIEKDKLYKGWPDSVSELLRPTFPGMLRSIRKNFFNVVFLGDPSRKESRPLLKLLESFYVHRAPTRVGLVFNVNDDLSATGQNDAGVALMLAFNYISANREPYDALAFVTDVYAQLEDDQDVDVETVHKQFLESYGADAKLDDVFGEDSEWDVGRQLAGDFVRRCGFKATPQVLMNGIPIDEKSLNGEDFEEAVMMALMKVTNELQRAVYKNQLKDKDDVLDYLMKQPNIMPRLNDRVLKPGQEATYIEMTGDVLPKLKASTFAGLNKAGMTSTLAEHLKYLTSKDDQAKLHVLTTWVAADLETKEGRDLVRSAVAHVKSSSLMRLGVLHNTPKPGLISRAVQLALETLDNAAAKHLLAKILKADTAGKLESGKKSLGDYDIPGADMAALSKAVADQMKEEEAADDDLFAIHRTYGQRVLGLAPGQRAVVLNGKLIGPLDAGESFGTDDFNLMEKFTMSQYGDKMVNSFYSFMDVKQPGVSDRAMKMVALLLTRTESKTRTAINFVSDKHSVIKVAPRFPDRPAFDVAAIVDPAGRGAQKIAPLLLVLEQVLNARISVYLNCVEKHSEMPQKSYYRAVLSPDLTFNPDGSLAQGQVARFANLPEELILTMHYHIPDNWLVEPVRSVYDLDNIKLSQIDGNVFSEFELEHLLLEGHCFEAFTGNPPRGLQLTLGTDQDPVVVDTIVMANLGYLQLKSKPGRWFLNLREGRSEELYDIVSHEGTEDAKDGGAIQVLMDSFQSKIVKLRVQKKPDKRNEDLLESDGNDSEDEGGLWNSISKSLGGSGGSSVSSGENGDDDDTLNIFCLASGHLYERLLKIMMLSTIRHTKAPVKFWILKNFLSPSLKEFLPRYAAEYGFQYEYVQYKWPRWLNQQKEKQRIIWGYKILFLDVMFPLDVKKIIFVDTDQIVRADLTELRDMDLHGAPYGYTPFCDSNKDMEGFRFWKSGYWKNHLSGRPYHISALYVVDLVRFRRIAAGDRLRGQYQALSQDPNSLSNLDQDLPNNMVHQVPIHSLPQEWLWCETWCDQASKGAAKSIDLCNNPLTKESKLDAARRIVGEWSDYDDEIHAKFAQDLSDATKDEEKHRHEHSEL